MINEYLVRKVAVKDMQPCLICGKPTVTVLYNSSGPDWLYSCDIHLRDNPQFAVPLYSKDYQEALSKLKTLKLQVDRLSAADKPSSWDGWVSNMFTKKASKEEDEPDDNKEKEEVDNLKEVQRKYSEQIDVITNMQKKNRKYQLSNITFESRVQRKKNEKMMAEKRRKEEELYANTDPDELIKKISFPTPPKGGLT